ncbi:MAG: prolyl oligopeptidase family serine peptidase [Verrucomicrobiota bacterium]
MGEFVYPDTKRGDVVDHLHGIEVPDPYRWLEDDNSEETAAWVEAQNEVTFGYLEEIEEREKIEKRLTELWNYERFGTPWKRAGQYFFSRNSGLQNQSVVFTTESLDGEPRVLIDPNELSEDGTIALSGYEVSHDGKFVAYSLSRSGSDWIEWRVKNVETGEDLPDLVEWSKFSGAAWSVDNAGFYYSRYDAPVEGEELKGSNYYQKVFYHRLGTPQSEDELIYERNDEAEWGFNAYATDDGNYLVIYVRSGAGGKNAVFFKELGKEGAEVVELLPDFDARYSVVGNEGSLLWIRTDLDAPRGRLIAIDLEKPAKENWKTLIPESKDTLRSVRLVGDQFVVVYMKDAHSAVTRVALDGEVLGEIELPGIGTVGGFGGKRHHRETFYSFSSFTAPSTIYRYDFDKNESTLFRSPDLKFDPKAFETRQVFYPSKDGTKIPMFIVHQKGLELNGKNPTLLYAYGGFNISILPRFSSSIIAWLEMGGVYAVPNLRGGGEYGEEWHEAGMREKKQNVFDDFIAAAEWLIANKYTSSEKLAISGGSNGGLLVGACMTQRPELFAACLPAVGVMDMLRFHKFTIGWAWTKEFGDPDDPEDFKPIYAYSPLHNLKEGVKYPSTMITTADHDDRVVPAHSFKFAAELQRVHGGENPVLIRIETKAGHGAGKPTSKRIAEAADKWAFLVRELGM